MHCLPHPQFPLGQLLRKSPFPRFKHRQTLRTERDFRMFLQKLDDPGTFIPAFLQSPDPALHEVRRGKTDRRNLFRNRNRNRRRRRRRSQHRNSLRRHGRLHPQHKKQNRNSEHAAGKRSYAQNQRRKNSGKRRTSLHDLFRHAEKLACIVRTLLRLLAHHAVDQTHEVHRKIGAQTGQRGRNVVDHLHHRLDRSSAVKRNAPACELIERRAERIDIGTDIDVVCVAALLRTRIGGSAEDGAFHRQSQIPERGERSRFCDAEVHQLQNAVAGPHDVARLDVPVNNSAASQDVERGRHLPENFQKLPFGKLAARGVTLQILSVDILHDNKEIARLVVAADIEHLHDVRVHERTGQTRLAEKTLARKIGTLLGQLHQFQRAGGAQQEMFRTIDFGHSAAAQETDDAVFVEEVARRKQMIRNRVALLQNLKRGAALRADMRSGGIGGGELAGMTVRTECHQPQNVLFYFRAAMGTDRASGPERGRFEFKFPNADGTDRGVKAHDFSGGSLSSESAFSSNPASPFRSCSANERSARRCS